MTIFRKGHAFKIDEHPSTSSWNFWDLWAGEQWEPELHDIIDQVLGADGLLVDVGAWFGPMTLWASRLPSRRVIALEPDPEAFSVLSANVLANGLQNVLAMPMAAANADGTMGLHSLRDSWGLSTSSLVFEGGLSVPVRTLDIVSLIEYVAPFYAGRMLVKMDTEGGEALVFNRLGPILRKHSIPILMSVHVGWPSLQPEWDEWTARDLHAAGHSYYLTSPSAS